MNDTLHEQTETFSVTLSAETNAKLDGGETTLSGTGTIDDNDELPKVSIANATAVVEGASAEFEVSLDVTSGSEVTVTYATGHTDDTAQSARGLHGRGEHDADLRRGRPGEDDHGGDRGRRVWTKSTARRSR